MESDLRRVLHNLTLHPPKDSETANRMDAIRSAAMTFARVIDDMAPGSRERNQAFTALEDATQYAIAAIARNQENS